MDTFKSANIFHSLNIVTAFTKIRRKKMCFVCFFAKGKKPTKIQIFANVNSAHTLFGIYIYLRANLRDKKHLNMYFYEAVR